MLPVIILVAKSHGGKFYFGYINHFHVGVGVVLKVGPGPVNHLETEQNDGTQDTQDP